MIENIIAATSFEIDGTVLMGIGTILAAGTGFLTWIMTRKEGKRDREDALITNALKLQEAAQESYEHAQRDVEALREEAAAARADIEGLVAIVHELKDEIDHWKKVALRAREAYQTELGREPSWWEPYEPKEVK